MPKAKAFASIAIPFWCNSSKISRAECPVANIILLDSIFVPFEFFYEIPPFLFHIFQPLSYPLFHYLKDENVKKNIN